MEVSVQSRGQAGLLSVLNKHRVSPAPVSGRLACRQSIIEESGVLRLGLLSADPSPLGVQHAPRALRGDRGTDTNVKHVTLALTASLVSDSGSRVFCQHP